MSTIRKTIVISFSVLCLWGIAQAQDSTDSQVLSANVPTVTASFEPDSIAIGDWFRVRVEVDKDIVQQVDFPTFQGQKMNDQIEILRESAVDTISRDGRRIRLAKEYIMTSFDAGNYNFGPFPVLYVDKNIVDTIWSADSLRMLVTTFAIDTTTQKIFDIKPPFDAPLRFGEIGGYMLGGVLFGLLAIGIFYLIQRKRQGKPLIGKPKPTLPGHIVAIQELEKLHQQKLWQSNHHKQYYTRLTDILREYLESRFGIQAREMTSDEILSNIAQLNLSDRSSLQLRDLLRQADLVKFAKLVPDAEENEQAYNNAYYFVEDTKPEATPTSDEITTTDNSVQDEENHA